MKSNKAEKIKTINKKTLIATLDIGKKILYNYPRPLTIKVLNRFHSITPVKALINSGKSFAGLKKNKRVMRL
jgi:hypothetical protein